MIYVKLFNEDVKQYFKVSFLLFIYICFLPIHSIFFLILCEKFCMAFCNHELHKHLCICINVQISFKLTLIKTVLLLLSFEFILNLMSLCVRQTEKRSVFLIIILLNICLFYFCIMIWVKFYYSVWQ